MFVLVGYTNISTSFIICQYTVFILNMEICYTVVMINEIIFDCFGVLTEDGWQAFVRQFETKENKDELAYLNHQIDHGTIAYNKFLKRLTELTKASEAEAHQIITTNHHPNKPLFSYINTLKERGYSLGIISNVGSPLSDYVPAEYLTPFDIITLSYQIGATKPEPMIYEYHLRQSGSAPDEVIFIDDRAVNCEGAALLGIHTIVYQNNEKIKQSLELLLTK